MKKLYMFAVLLWSATVWSMESPSSSWGAPLSPSSWKQFTHATYDTVTKSPLYIAMKALEAASSLKRKLFPGRQSHDSKKQILTKWHLLWLEHKDAASTDHVKSVIQTFIAEHGDTFEHLSALIDSHDSDGRTLLEALVFHKIITDTNDDLYRYLVDELQASVASTLFQEDRAAEPEQVSPRKKPPVKRKLFDDEHPQKPPASPEKTADKTTDKKGSPGMFPSEESDVWKYGQPIASQAPKASSASYACSETNKKTFYQFITSKRAVCAYGLCVGAIFYSYYKKISTSDMSTTPAVEAV